MNKYILILSTFIGLVANAQDHTPIFDTEKNIGRMGMMEDMSGNQVYVPALFSQEIHCNEKNSLCTFQVFNKMNTEEENSVLQIRSSGIQTLSLKPELFKTTIINIKEVLSGDISKIQSSFLTLNNLSILEDAYGTSVFMPPNKDYKSIVNKYETEGLGQYLVNYQINGVRRDFSIRIPMETLIYLISKQMSNKQLGFSDLKNMIKSEMTEIKIKGFETDDAIVIIAYQIKGTLLKSNYAGKLIVDLTKWNEFKNSMKSSEWVMGEAYSNSSRNCTVTLLIKKDSEMHSECEEINEVQ